MVIDVRFQLRSTCHRTSTSSTHQPTHQVFHHLQNNRQDEVEAHTDRDQNPPTCGPSILVFQVLRQCYCEYGPLFLNAQSSKAQSFKLGKLLAIIDQHAHAQHGINEKCSHHSIWKAAEEGLAASYRALSSFSHSSALDGIHDSLSSGALHYHPQPACPFGFSL